jgi:hypothetical protein
MAEPYLTATEFRNETIMPAEHVDEINLIAPLWLGRQLLRVSGWIDSKLRKRYAAPFASPYPETVRDWLTRIVTHLCYLRRGVDPTDAQATEIKDSHDTAKAEIDEAANGELGLFDLPLRSDTTATGISKGGPLGYSEASPYVGFTAQRTTARNEDERGGGSYG